MKICQKNLFFALFPLALLASPVSALSITNLDSKPHQVEIRSIGNSSRTLEIASNATAYINEHNPAIAQIGGADPHVINAHNDEEYTIWRDGKIQLQRYNYFSEHSHH